MKILTVSELAKRINQAFSQLGEFWVVGEISNLKMHSSGHIYFTLKDEEAQIDCALFRSRRSRVLFQLKEGLKYKIRGTLDYWAKGGRTSIIVEEILPAGLGELALRFEMLKTKLKEEGLFDPEHKKPLPAYPLVIGVVTSREGAAIRDIVRILRKRFPPIKIILRPVLVQGEDAAQDIADAIDEFNLYGKVDLLIVGRGGGSLEDLWPFNEEIVARAIYRSRIPVISAVGHEIDFSISDFVADRRAATPSEAAEIAVRSSAEIINQLNQIERRMVMGIERRLRFLRERVDGFGRMRVLKDPMVLVEKKRLFIDHAIEKMVIHMDKRLKHQWRKLERLKPFPPDTERWQIQLESLNGFLQRSIVHRLNTLKRQIDSFSHRLNALSPENVLKRGYTLVFMDGKLVKDGKFLKHGDEINIRFRDGERDARIE